MHGNFKGFKTIEINGHNHLMFIYKNHAHYNVLCGEEIPDETFLLNAPGGVDCPHCLAILKLIIVSLQKN